MENKLEKVKSLVESLEFEDLEKLHNQFYAMGNEVLSQINRTVRAFVTHDRELARQVIEDDAEVNEYEVKLEKKSLEIIALQQPVSQDLRTVITVLKASSDLERMGDHAVSIAKATVRMKGEVRIESVEDAISKMGRDVKNFVEETLNVYLNGNVDQAYAVAAMDEKINQYFDDIRDLATEEIKQNPELIVTGRDYFQVISYLERIGDYAKNICEWVVYFETGKIIEL